MRKPTISQFVQALVHPSKNNGTDVATAVITRVFSPIQAGDDAAWCVNARLLLDSPDTDWVTSVYVYESEEIARAHQATPLQVCLYWPASI